MISRQFQHQEVELIQMADSCIEAGALLKVVIDNPLLNEEMVIILCRMAKRVNAHYVTTTQPRDLELVRKHCGFHVEVECGGVRTLAEALDALPEVVVAAGEYRLVGSSIKVDGYTPDYRPPPALGQDSAGH